MKTAYFNRFEIVLPDKAVEDCHHQGACDDDVKYWASKLILDISPELLREELREYGAWDDEQLSNHDDNIERILWIAAGNIQEEEEYLTTK